MTLSFFAMPRNRREKLASTASPGNLCCPENHPPRGDIDDTRLFCLFFGNRSIPGAKSRFHATRPRRYWWEGWAFHRDNSDDYGCPEGKAIANFLVWLLLTRPPTNAP